MGEADVRTSEFFENNNFFADMGNAYFFRGKPIIKPECLQEANKELTYVQNIKGKKVIRDNVKKYFHNTLLCIYVLEHQMSVDYHMVLRNMLAEAMEYHRQWKMKKRLHEREKDLEGGNEFISGMKKTERFTPVLSLVVYYGKEKWDAAGCLQELLDMDGLPAEMVQYISNYQIHVFDYHNYENFDMFHTELKQVFAFLKCADDWQKLKKLIAEQEEDYYNISKEACDLIATLTKSKELLKLQEYKNEETGGINMCKALEELKMEGIALGRAEGQDDKTRTIVSNMLNRNMPVEEICALAECSQELVEEIQKSGGTKR